MLDDMEDNKKNIEKEVSKRSKEVSFKIVPAFKDTKDVIKNSGGSFPYISVCLGVGCNFIYYGKPGDQWSFTECNGIINFSSPNPIYRADPKDMSDLYENHPGMYSNFYEGGELDYNRLDCVLKASRQLMAAENRASCSGVCYGNIHPQIFQPLLMALRDFSVKVKCPIEIWCIPEVALANVMRVATKLLEEAIIKYNSTFTQEYFFMICLRVIVLMVYRDDAGLWCMKDDAGRIINPDVLACTELFQGTKEIAFDAESSYKVNDISKLSFFGQWKSDDSLKLTSKSAPAILAPEDIPMNQEGWPAKNSGVILDNINQ